MQKISLELPERIVEEGLNVVVSWANEVPLEYIQQVIKKSREPHVMKFEGHEDAEGRFKDVPSYKKWAEKERLVYLLVSGNPDDPKKSKVGGIIWFGKRDNEVAGDKYTLTFGIRLYEGCVGKKLSVPFMKVTHEDLPRFYPKEAVWLDFAEDNIAAERAYQSFGYRTIGETDGRIVMGYSYE